MKDEFAKHELDYIEIYQKKGYTDNFRIVDEQLVSSETGDTFAPTALTIMGENRFEGMSDPSDLSILYAIKTNSNLKGTLLMPYGPNANVSDYEFIKKIPEVDDSDRIDEPV